MMGIDSERYADFSSITRKTVDEGLNLLMVDDHIPAGAKLY